MRAAVVSSKTIAKYGRMDPGFYLGLVDGKEENAAVDRAELRVKQAARAVTARAEARARRAQMISSGEVVPIPDRV